jgi:hypothetical protein
MAIDAALNQVVAAIQALDPDGERTGNTIRRTFDQLYDGKRTGRYRWDQLYKTEKTHCGTLIEINLQREFKFNDGSALDYEIATHEVDCKYSQTHGGWMIPQEALGHLCLLVTADDQAATWSMGIVRIASDLLSRSSNRDTKRTLSTEGRSAIEWLYRDARLPPNPLLQLPRPVVDKIMGLRSGQQRVNEVFRVAQRVPFTGTVIETLAQQDDPNKRVRKNGGARTRLRREGIIILGDYLAHQDIARRLGLPVPQEGEFVSVRVSPAQSEGTGVAVIDNGLWRVAAPDDPICIAPDTPEQRRRRS